MVERRSPHNADPVLTTRRCADRIGVGPAFVVGEILEGRLRALIIRRDGKRAVYRIAPVDWEAWLTRYGWSGRATDQAGEGE